MWWCSGRVGNACLCEYGKECNEKIECTTCDDINRGIYPVYLAGFGECKRDDGGINMSEAVREMTREELIAERDKYRAEADRQYRNKCKLECQIKEMQSHIDCLKAELIEVQHNKQELPEEPIKIADLLIDKHIEYEKEFDRCFNIENAGKLFVGSPIEEFRQIQIGKLKQIAEHLLVYCNHEKVE